MNMKENMEQEKKDRFIVAKIGIGDDDGYAYVRHEADILPPDTYHVNHDGYRLVYNPADINEEPVQIAPDSLAAKVSAEIKQFMAGREKYRQFNLPFKRGYLLFGEPGCGKSALIREIQREFIKTGGLVLLMNHYTVDGYNDIRGAEPTRPIMVVCEDVDSMRSISEESLLEFLDGQTVLTDAIFLATTNKMGEIAKRLTERPSRIDRVLEILPPTENDRAYYLKNFNLDEEMKKRFIKLSNNLTFAQIKEMVLLHTIFNVPIEEAAKRMQGLNKKSLISKITG